MSSFKTTWTLEEIRDVLLDPHTQPNKDIIEMIMHVERLFYDKHTDDIRARQDKLKYIEQDEHRFVSFWFGGPAREKLGVAGFKELIAPGCRACLFGLINHVRHSTKCTQSCEFCYYRSQMSKMQVSPIGKGMYTFSSAPMTYTLEEAKLLIDRQAVKSIVPYEAIGWLQKEPLEEMESLQKLMPFIASRGFYQYLYTNGVRADKEVIDILADCGLNEIRFNLQSTDFHSLVIDRMAYAKEKIKWVLVETPIYTKSYFNYVTNIEDILATGVDQLNMPELQVCAPDLMKSVIDTEGPLYKHRRGYVSPISSRHLVYDLIERAEAEDWPVIINDCSNDTKFFRGTIYAHSLGHVAYESSFELPLELVYYLAEQVLEPGVEYEFF